MSNELNEAQKLGVITLLLRRKTPITSSNILEVVTDPRVVYIGSLTQLILDNWERFELSRFCEFGYSSLIYSWVKDTRVEYTTRESSSVIPIALNKECAVINYHRDPSLVVFFATQEQTIDIITRFVAPTLPIYPIPGGFFLVVNKNDVVLDQISEALRNDKNVSRNKAIQSRASRRV